uniref:Fibronectin type-III domain-containing protein n=1 Tax=Anopheles epiroticus TaxID=199890 RepID=A0A182P597_9DIPT
MMDVDQPVPSKNDEEQSALDGKPTKTTGKGTPENVEHESEDLPALLISDSEEDEPPPKAASIGAHNNRTDEKAKPPVAKVDVSAGNISGITPIETTIASEEKPTADDGKKGVEKQTKTAMDMVVDSTTREQKRSSPSLADEEDVSLVENIDLTGTSSAEELSISEAGNEKAVKKSVKKAPSTPAKPSSEMTAQELLESLLGAQEEAFAAHRASESANRSDLMEFSEESKIQHRKDSKNEDDLVMLDDTSVCIVESEAKKSANSATSNGVTEDTAQDYQPDSGRVESAAISSDTEKSSKSKTVTDGPQGKDGATGQPAKLPDADGSNAITILDDECLLEEVSNVSQKQRKQSGAYDRNSSSTKDCSTALDDGKQMTELDRNDSGIHEKQADTGVDGVDDTNTLDTSEPPRKKARSISVVSEGCTTEPADKPCVSVEGFAGKGDNLKDRLEEPMDVPATQNVNLSEAAVDSLERSTETAKESHSDVTSKDNHGTVSEGSEQANRECSANEDKKHRNTAQPNECTDVLVIDDDEDEPAQPTEPAVDSVKEQIKVDSAKGEEKMDSKTDIDVKTPKTESSLLHAPEIKVRLSPIPDEMKVCTEPLKLEFVRNFCKPLSELTRSDLEELVLQKISEALVHKSANAELRTIIKKQATRLQGIERALADMTSHYEGLRLVTERAIEDVMNKNKSYVAPVKITRAVGIQVSRCGTNSDLGSGTSTLHSGKRKGESAVLSVPVSTGPFNGVNEHSAREAPSEPPTKRLNMQSVVSISRNVTIVTPPRQQVANNAPQMMTARTVPNTTTANGATRSFKPYVAKPSNNVAATVVAAASPVSTINRAPGTVASVGPGVITSNSSPVSSAHSTESGNSNSSSTAAGAVDGPVRKKLQKITPMRPPLSAYQQAQQVKQARQQQEMLLQQIQEQNQQAQRKSQTNASLIDLTEEDETIQSMEQVASSTANTAKRPRSSLNDPPTIALAQATAAMTPSYVATNQLLRIQARVTKTADGTTVAVPTNAPISAAGSVPQQNGIVGRPGINLKRISAPPLAPIRPAIYNNSVQRLPDPALLKKRLLMKPIQALIVPLPPPGPQPENNPSWKLPPPQPKICVNNVQSGIVISWLMPDLTDRHAEIENYQIYAYQELTVPSTQEEWRHVGDVKALLLPMAVTLTQFQEGQRYYFAVRAIDIHKRTGLF